MTEKLVKAGYQQISGGYIDRARWRDVKVSYKDSSPSQYWHLMNYCDSRRTDHPFTKSVTCGELIFWMAEASGVVEKEQLERLANQIIESTDLSTGVRPIYDRIKWNRKIQDLCFDGLLKMVINE